MADTQKNAIRIAAVTPFIVAALSFMASSSALGTWKPEYAAQSFEVQFWYQNAELTDAAQKRFPFKKCCAKSDVVKTKFKVDRSNGADEWWWLDGADWRRIPADIIHWQEHAPNGMPTLFVYSGQETCFFPGEDGI